MVVGAAWVSPRACKKLNCAAEGGWCCMALSAACRWRAMRSAGASKDTHLMNLPQCAHDALQAWGPVPSVRSGRSSTPQCRQVRVVPGVVLGCSGWGLRGTMCLPFYERLCFPHSAWIDGCGLSEWCLRGRNCFYAWRTRARGIRRAPILCRAPRRWFGVPTPASAGPGPSAGASPACRGQSHLEPGHSHCTRPDGAAWSGNTCPGPR